MKVYLDNAATTQVDSKVFKAMLPYFKENFGNPSSLHSWGQEARKATEDSRKKVASILGCDEKEVIFTSCATESINLALKGVVEVWRRKNAKEAKTQKPHIISSPIEHHAGVDSTKHLEKLGVDVTWLPVDRHGLVNFKDVEKAIKENTVLVSVMYVNNEVGTIEPIEEIGKLLKKINQSQITPARGWSASGGNNQSRIYFHTDAVQAIQYLDCNVQKLGVDLLSLSGHKFHAPKGVGVLFKRSKTPLVRQQDGGEQEFNLRAGTENVAYIVGLAKALELVEENKMERAKKVAKLRDKLIEGTLKIKGVQPTGHPQKRVSHIASFVVEGAEGESMILSLDEKGIAASSGSACTSSILEPSHVLIAMGIPPELAHGSLRFSLSSYITEEEIDYVLRVLPKIIKRLRKISPFKIYG